MILLDQQFKFTSLPFKKIVSFFVFIFVFSTVGLTTIYAQETSPQFIHGNDTLVVYKDVPTLAASDKYTLRVRSAATNNEWFDVFTNNTYNRANELENIPLDSPTGGYRGSVVQAYAVNQKGWSHTYGNIEMNIGQVVEVEIAAKNGFKIGGQDFFKAKVHPAQKASTATLNNGKIYFTITKPGQLYIDINGQMDDYNQAINSIGHPVHAISLFANPVIKKPSLTDSRTQIIEPGTTLATINAINPADYDTMYFKPGVHDIGSGIKVHPGKTVYIPGDAFIYGTFNNYGVPLGTYSKTGENITIYGYGTICGAKIPNYQFAWYYPTIIVDGDKPLGITNGLNAKLFGVTLADNGGHSVDGASGGATIRWLKTITWRANGDGLGGYMYAEDCFIRTQDDCSYIKASKKRCTFWKDNNAALFHMANIPENSATPIILEDCDVLYARLRTNPGTNGGGFQQRGEGTSGQRKVNLIVKDFRIHDKLVNMSLFSLVSFQGNSTAPTQVGSSYSGILFQNVSIAGMASGNKQRILGCAAAPWYGGIIFDNLTVGGTLVTPENQANYFNTNEFVKDIWYKMPAYYAITTNANPLQGTITFATTDTSRFAIRATDNTYMEKSTVVFTASAIPGYKFTSWSGDVISTINPLSVEMDSNKTLTANFEYVGFKTLTVTSSGNGTVVTNPTGINHTLNNTVAITAKPAIGYKFSGWSGDLNNQDIITNTVMETDKTVTANFIKTNDFAVNYNGDQYIASNGTVYAQTPASGFTTSNAISGTADQFLYQSEKSGKTFSLSYPVDNGQYEVVLKFAEIFQNAVAKRIFNVAIEGNPVLANFDIFAEVGGRYKAVDKTFQTTVADGNLSINFTTISDNAKISAIKISRIPETIPTFAAVSQYCYGEILTQLPTTSTNGITGTWSPALNNLATTTYTFTPTAGQYAATTTVTIEIGGLTIWNGTSWSNGIPDSNKKAIISGNYSQAANVSACSLEVTGTAIVTVPTGFNFTISGKVTVAPAASLTLENNTNLIQLGNIQNDGNITIKRNSNPLKRLDYTLWSSPVTNANQFLTTFSPLTATNRFYNYNSIANVYNAIINPGTTPFNLGTGYLIRVPNTHPDTPTVWTGSFTGVPNNGPIAIAVANNTYNAIGNPYPSSINANAFIDDNSLNEALYFWRKTNNALFSSYATYTKAGGTSNSGGLSSIAPNGIIQVGQGFIAKSTSSALLFDNAMRIANNDNQFLKTKGKDKHRIWLNLSKDSQPVNQMMVAYMSGATEGIDRGIDGKYFGDSSVALTSNISNQEYVIQGRPLFDPTDVVALNFKTDVDGSYTIAIDYFDGVFETGQDVYLVDGKTGTETDLKTMDYTFTAKAGEDTTRFSLKYQKVLKINAPTFNENSVRVYKNNGTLYINSEFILIANVKVYDAIGRLIIEKKNCANTKVIIKDLKSVNQVLIVKVTGEDKNVVTKKVLN